MWWFKLSSDKPSGVHKLPKTTYLLKYCPLASKSTFSPHAQWKGTCPCGKFGQVACAESVKVLGHAARRFDLILTGFVEPCVGCPHYSFDVTATVTGRILACAGSAAMGQAGVSQSCLMCFWMEMQGLSLCHSWFQHDSTECLS